MDEYPSQDLSGPLSLQDIQRIESTMLSSVDKHHLRILAHCLECFKSMDQQSSNFAIPKEDNRIAWCLKQPNLANQKTFIPVFLEQLRSAGLQLEDLAQQCKKPPLLLNLDDLINCKINATQS